MQVDQETAEICLAMLNVAAASLIEDTHFSLLDVSDRRRNAYHDRARALTELAADLSALGAAADVLVRRWAP